MNTWDEFVCAVNDLKEIVTSNTSFDNFDFDDLKSIMVKVHEILHILNKERMNELTKKGSGNNG